MMLRSSCWFANRTRFAMPVLAAALLVGVGRSDAEAAIALVQTVGGTATKTTGTSLAVTVAAPGVTAGDTLTISFAMDPAAGAVTCADTKGNTYSVDADVTNGSGTTGVRALILSARVTTALVAGDTITITHPSVDARVMSVNEFSGLRATGRLDRTATATGSSTNLSAGPTAVTSQPDELLMGVVGVETKKGEPLTQGTGYTALPGANTGTFGALTSNMSVDEEYRIVSATGAYVADGTLITGRQWAMIIATYRSQCGDGVVDSGEQCDDGNNQNGDCCSSNCQIEAAGTVCRPAAGACDVAETCTGSSGSCPADGFVSSSTVCRAAAGVCDLVENCTGTSAACPADAKSTALCRPSAGVCDVAESCDGVGNTCPADALASPGTVCRPAAGICDVAETCTGANVACPADGVAAAATVCRPAAGVCDVAESCTGGGPACPADTLVAAGTECRASAGVCDVAESCTGTSTSCPTDGFAAAGVQCRAAAGACDVAE